MTIDDLYTLLPLIILATGVIVVMLVIAFYRNHRATYWLTQASLIAAFVTLFSASPALPRQITPLIIVDGFAIYYIGLILATGFTVAIFSFDFLERSTAYREEYYLLLLLAIFGSTILVVSNHFASLLLGLEILSIALYALIAYPRLQHQRVEAAIKYLILAGSTAAFLIFGMALVYLETGTLEFRPFTTGDGRFYVLMLAGWGLMTVGIAFKLALVPFHVWTPDVYQGAPPPVTGFVATVSKGGVFALMLRYFVEVSIHDQETLWSMFAIIAIASMLAGNLLALLQNSVKRILAYSSVAHLGYLMVAFLASGSFAQPAVAFYLVAYFLTLLCAFGVLTLLSSPEKEADDLEDFRGLFWQRPWLALVLAVSFLSLAGIPPSAGLIGKIYIAVAGVESDLWLLLIILVVGSVIGVFYYLRVVIALFQRRPEEIETSVSFPPLQFTGMAVLGVLALLVVGLGIYPVPVFRLIEAVVTILG